MRESTKKVTMLATASILALFLMAPTILTTGALAAPKIDKGCKDIQFHTFESDRAITIETPQDKFSVEVDYSEDTGGFEPNPYFKNVAAEDPAGPVVLPGGEIITITMQTVEELSSFGTYVTLYNNKVSDCEILLGLTKAKNKVDFEFIDAQQIAEFTVQLTVRVPDASDVGTHFTKLGVQFPSTPESTEYHLISKKVQIT